MPDLKPFVTVTEEDPQELETKVNSLISKGYALSGEITTVKDYRGENLLVACLVLNKIVV